MTSPPLTDEEFEEAMTKAIDHGWLIVQGEGRIVVTAEGQKMLFTLGFGPSEWRELLHPHTRH